MRIPDCLSPRYKYRTHKGAFTLPGWATKAASSCRFPPFHKFMTLPDSRCLWGANTTVCYTIYHVVSGHISCMHVKGWYIFFFFISALILHSDYFLLLKKKKKKSLHIESKTSCNKGKSMAPHQFTVLRRAIGKCYAVCNLRHNCICKSQKQKIVSIFLLEQHCWQTW